MKLPLRLLASAMLVALAVFALNIPLVNSAAGVTIQSGTLITTGTYNLIVGNDLTIGGAIVSSSSIQFTTAMPAYLVGSPYAYSGSTTTLLPVTSTYLYYSESALGGFCWLAGAQNGYISAIPIQTALDTVSFTAIPTPVQLATYTVYSSQPPILITENGAKMNVILPSFMGEGYWTSGQYTYINILVNAVIMMDFSPSATPPAGNSSSAFSDASNLMNSLLSLNFFQAFLGTFSMVLGSWFYVIAIAIFAALLMMRGQSLALVAVIVNALVACFYMFLPYEAIMVVSLITTLFFVFALLRFFTGGDVDYG